jgi:hypothetical protein
MGPVTFQIIEFPGSKFKGEIIPALIDLVDNGMIRILDLLVVRKYPDGAIEAIEVSALPSELADSLAPLVPPTVGLFSHMDIEILGDSLETDSSAGFLVFENLWAKPFADVNAEGRWLLMQSVPQQVLEEAIAALQE